MLTFPSWRYRADGRACVVNSPVEDAALGEGWAESPAAFAGSAPHPPPSDPPPSTGTPDPPQMPEESATTLGAEVDATFQAIAGPKRGRPKKSAE